MYQHHSGQILKERYQFIKVIGQGAFGVVYEAYDKHLGRSVAIKQFAPPSRADLLMAEARFRREAETMAAVSHPHIVPIIDNFTEQAVLYHVMDYCVGGNLADYMEKQGAMPVESVITIGRSLADALITLHSLKIIHRDIKPANIFLHKIKGKDDLIVKLGDFGVAHLPDATPLTKVDEVVGTPLYLSPEQITKKEALPASDIYGLGVVLYQLLTGRHYLSGKMPLQQGIVKEAPRPLNQMRPDVPSWLSDLVMGMLQKAPHHRPTAKEVYEKLASPHQGIPEVDLNFWQLSAFFITTTIVTVGLVWGSYTGQLNIFEWSAEPPLTPVVTQPAPLLNTVQGVNGVGGLKLRATPDTNGEILQYLPDGTLVAVLETRPEDKWVLVEVNGTQGWVYGDYLTE